MSQRIDEIVTAAAALLGYIGITAALGDFFGGLFLAVACGSLIAIFLPDSSWKERLSTIIAAVIIATLVAGADTILFPDLLLQTKMAISGAAARFIVLLFVSIGNNLLLRSKDIADAAANKIKDIVE